MSVITVSVIGEKKKYLSGPVSYQDFRETGPRSFSGGKESGPSVGEEGGWGLRSQEC